MIDVAMPGRNPAGHRRCSWPASLATALIAPVPRQLDRTPKLAGNGRRSAGLEWLWPVRQP